MSAQILEGDCVRESDGCKTATVHGENTYGCNHLGMWMLMRNPDQRGCWYVALFLRGLYVTALAVQDDFGNLQMVAV